MASSTQAGFDLSTICDVLGSIKTKWFGIGVRLGIPRCKLLEFKGDPDPLSAVVDYWLRENVPESVSPRSWDSIVTALKSEYVGEPGLADKISKKYGQVKIFVEEEHYSSTSSQQPESQMPPDVKLDLEFILEKNLKRIVNQYASYVDCLREAISMKQVPPEDLQVYLLSLPAFKTSHKGNKLSLLSDKKQELQNCKSIAAIFAFLTTECASFLNYEIFESVRKRYKVTDEEEIATYPESLKIFINKHKISEFARINPLLKKKKGCRELTLKYDIETMCNLAKVDELKKTIAEIMDLSPSALEIVDIEEGCVMVTFLIPASVADALFTPDTVFTPQQEEEFKGAAVLRINCNGRTYNFDVETDEPSASSKIVGAFSTLKKLKEQLTCSICLGTYTDPKLLQCQHAYCQQCLMGLVQQDQQGRPTLTCPTCRQVTPVPASGVAGLQADFRANQLLEVVGEDTKDGDTAPVMIQTNLELPKVTFAPAERPTIPFLEHDGKEIVLFCETCGGIICINCGVEGGRHHNHDYNDLNQVYERYKAMIPPSLETIEKVLKKLDTHCDEISSQRASIEEEIQTTIVVDARKTELISQLQQLTQAKFKSIAAQRDQIEVIQVQLIKHLRSVREKCCTNEELRTMKSKMIKQIKKLMIELASEKLEPNNEADIMFSGMTDSSTGEGYGLISVGPPHFDFTFPNDIFVEKSTSCFFKVLDIYNQPRVVPINSITSFLIHETSIITDCKIEKISVLLYKISFRPPIIGIHQLHITLEGQHVKGSPFPVRVKLPGWTTFGRVGSPDGIAVNQDNEVIVTSSDEHCVTVFSANGERLRSFGTFGSGEGQFKNPSGVAVDNKENILVADSDNNRIQMFTACGGFLQAVGQKGSELMQFNSPRGIAVNPSNQRVYVTDVLNNRIQIFNSDLSYFGTFGEKGRDEGRFNVPSQIACDREGKVYVADTKNHRIQVFTAEGEFLRLFGTGRHSEGSGKLHYPYGIAVDSRSNMVYVSELGNYCTSVFTSSDGHFSYAFGKKREGIKNPHCLAVNSNGVLYMCAYLESHVLSL